MQEVEEEGRRGGRERGREKNNWRRNEKIGNLIYWKSDGEKDLLSC